MILSEHYAAIAKAMRANDWETATRVQRRTNQLNAVLCAKNNISAYKVVLKNLGIIQTANMRAPLDGLSETDSVSLLADLKAMQFQQVLV